jgi:hypothetical protein
MVLRKAVEQGTKIGNVTDVTAQCVRTDVLLQDGAHPLECDLPRLFTPVGLQGDAHHPTSIAEKPLRALGRYDWGIHAGKQEK